MATLPIQRLLESGAKVPCWKTAGVPFGFLNSYQRTPVLELLFPLPPPTVTEWFTTSDSCPSRNVRYASRYIKRSASESSCWLVPGCGMQVPPPPHAGVNAATGIFLGPVNVELAGVMKSTWNFHRFKELLPKF